jgi:hypothetical protein
MWRVSVVLLALVAASCTAGGESSVDSRAVADSSAPTLPDQTVATVEVAESVASGDEDPVAPVPSGDFGRPFDVETDPYFERQSRPILPADPTETWSVDVDRVTVPFADTVGGVVVLHTIAPNDEQKIVAFDRTDGAVAWEFDPDQTIGSVSVVGDRVLVLLAETDGQRAVRLDGSTGRELPFPSDDNLGPRGRFVGAFTTGTCDVRNYDPSTGELVGEYCPLGAGPNTFVSRVGDSAVELDPIDLRPVSDPIPIDEISEQRRVMVFGDTVVAHSLSALDFLDRSGEIVASLSNPGDVMLTPAGVGSDVLIVYDYDVSTGLDVRTMTPIWQRPHFVVPFGLVDGEAIGTTRNTPSTEVFSLDTGETKCVIDADVEFAQNGFYGPDGVAYDLDCVRRWAIDVGDEVEFHVVDSGVVRVERTGEDTTEIRYLS